MISTSFPHSPQSFPQFSTGIFPTFPQTFPHEVENRNIIVAQKHISKFVQKLHITVSRFQKLCLLSLLFFGQKRCIMVIVKEEIRKRTGQSGRLAMRCGAEGGMMMTFYVKLNEINDVYKLVETLLAFNGEVDMTSGRYTVDGRSILGIFSLDLRKPVKVTLHKGQGEDADKGMDALMEKLKPFLCDPE